MIDLQKVSIGSKHFDFWQCFFHDLYFTGFFGHFRRKANAAYIPVEDRSSFQDPSPNRASAAQRRWQRTGWDWGGRDPSGGVALVGPEGEVCRQNFVRCGGAHPFLQYHSAFGLQYHNTTVYRRALITGVLHGREAALQRPMASARQVRRPRGAVRAKGAGGENL